MQLDCEYSRTGAVGSVVVKFLQDNQKYCKRRAKISANISARLFRVTCNKISSMRIHKI